MNDLHSIFEQFDKVAETLDCGDNSCMFKKRDRMGGMRTNGGCRCLWDLPPPQRRVITRLLQIIKLVQDSYV